jgi:hypothetical protein
MPKYRKKPMIVEAEQWWSPATAVPGVKMETLDEAQTPRAYVVTVHGQRAYLAPGDWVITEMDGVHHYPCKPDVFEATYEQ